MSQVDSILKCNSVLDLIALEKESDSHTYGDGEKFKILKGEAVRELSATLEGMRDGNLNHFRTILDQAAKLRGHIARETGTKNPELFGSCRDRERDGAVGEYFCTELWHRHYGTANENIKELIIDHLRYIKEKDHAYRVTKKDDQTRYSIKLISKTIMSAITDNAAFGMVLGQSDDHNGLIEQMLLEETGLEYLAKFKELVEIFKKQRNQTIHHSQDKFYLFLGRMQIKGDGGQWLPTTRHITVIPCDDAGEITANNLDDFRKHFFVQLIHTAHQDFHLHDKTMCDLFTKILDRGTSKEELPKVIREFEYRLHQLCYFKRGSAAINEMILEAIRDTICPEYVLKGNLEALAEPYLCKYSN